MPKYVRGVFIMWKKILISIGLIIILIAGIEIFNISKRNTNEEKNNICLMHFRCAFGVIRTKKKK